MAHFVTDKVVVGLQIVGAALLGLAAIIAIGAIGLTTSVDGLLGATLIAGLAFGMPGIGLLGLSYWFDGQSAKLEGHPGERRAFNRTTEATHPFRAPVQGYLIAIGAALVAWAIRAVIEPLLPGAVPFVTFYAAVALAGWSGGHGPAIVCTIVCTFIARYYYMEPLHALLLMDPTGAMRLGSFVLVGLVIGSLTAALRAALQRIQDLVERVQVLEAESRKPPVVKD